MSTHTPGIYTRTYGKRGAAVGALLEHIAGLEDSQANPDRDCYARNRTHAKHITTSKRTVQRYLAKLKSLDHIVNTGKLSYGHDRELRLTAAGREIFAQAQAEKVESRERQSNSGRGDIRFRGDTGGATVAARGMPADRGGVSGDAASRSSVHPVPDPVRDPRDLAIARLEAQVQELTKTIAALKRRTASAPGRNRHRQTRPAMTRRELPVVSTWNELEGQLQATISPGSLAQIRAAYRGEAFGRLTFAAGLPAFQVTLIESILDRRVEFIAEPTCAEQNRPERTVNHAA